MIPRYKGLTNIKKYEKWDKWMFKNIGDREAQFP